MISENITPKGTLVITLTGPDGQIKDQRVTNNLVVDAGKVAIAQSLYSVNTSPYFTYMALGTDTGPTAPVYSQTALITETASSRINTGTAAIVNTGTNTSFTGTVTAGSNQITAITGSAFVGQVLQITTNTGTATLPTTAVIIDVTGAVATMNVVATGSATSVGATILGHSTSVVYTWTWTANVPSATLLQTFTEAGIFNAASVGTMLSRVSFSGVAKQGGADSLQIKWIVSLI